MIRLLVVAGDAPAASNTPFWLSLVAIVLLLVSGWLGGKLVYEAGVAVDTEGLQGRSASARPSTGSLTDRTPERSHVPGADD